MTVEYFVFPDRREAVGEDGPLVGTMLGNSADLMKFLGDYKWKYPIHVVYRESRDDRWFFGYVKPVKESIRAEPD